MRNHSGENSNWDAFSHSRVLHWKQRDTVSKSGPCHSCGRKTEFPVSCFNMAEPNLGSEFANGPAPLLLPPPPYSSALLSCPLLLFLLFSSSPFPSLLFCLYFLPLKNKWIHKNKISWDPCIMHLHIERSASCELFNWKKINIGILNKLSLVNE